jgi:hypothetical protein
LCRPIRESPRAGRPSVPRPDLISTGSEGRESTLAIPGISVLRCPSPGEAARQMRAAFPRAKGLHEAAKTVGLTTEDLIRGAGFDLIHAPSQALTNHYRIIHPQGVAGFTDENLAKLTSAFVDTVGH